MAEKKLKVINDDEKILSKIKIGDDVYNLKDAGGRELIAAETTRATGVESGLDTRVSNLEARGRYLSTWDCSTGLPGDYPQIPEGTTGTYTYSFKAGDYYIINNLPASGTKYMPDGISITATQSSEGWTWTVGKKAYEGEATLVVGGQFVYSTSGWNYVATAKDTAWGQIIGTLSNQTDLKNALDAKLDHKSGKTGAAGDLAYKDSASGTFAESSVTGTASGTITASLSGDLGYDSVNANVSYAQYQPYGTVSGDAINGGTVTVTIKDAESATAVTNLEFEDYTPEGTIDKPNINLTKSEVGVLTGVSAAGTLPSFTEGAFSAAEIQEGFFSAGNVNLGTFSAGAMPTLGTATTGSFATAGLVFSSYADEMITFGNATLASAVTAQGSLTGGVVPTWTGSSITAPAIDTTKFFGGSKVADTFTSGAMPTFSTGSVNNVTAAALATAPAFTGTASAVKLSGAKYLKQEISAASFSGTSASLSFSGAVVSSAFVTSVTYNKATKGTLAASASITGGSLSLSAKVASQTITVS